MREQLLDIFLEEIERHPEYLEGILQYWFVNNYRQLIRLTPLPKNSPSRSMIDGIKKQIRLLDMRLPSGKTLGESTGTECAALGGWLVAVGEKAGDRIVAETFSERELQALMRQHHG